MTATVTNLFPIAGLTDAEAQAVIAWCAKARAGLLDVSAETQVTEQGDLYAVIVGEDGEPRYTVCRERGRLSVLDAAGVPVEPGFSRVVDDLVAAVQTARAG